VSFLDVAFSTFNEQVLYLTEVNWKVYVGNLNAIFCNYITELYRTLCVSIVRLCIHLVSFISRFLLDWSVYLRRSIILRILWYTLHSVLLKPVYITHFVINKWWSCISTPAIWSHIFQSRIFSVPTSARSTACLVQEWWRMLSSQPPCHRSVSTTVTRWCFSDVSECVCMCGTTEGCIHSLLMSHVIHRLARSDVLHLVCSNHTARWI